MTAAALDTDRRIQFVCDVMDILERHQVGGRTLTTGETQQLEKSFDRGYSPREAAELIAADRTERGVTTAVQTLARTGDRLTGFAATIANLRSAAVCPTCKKTTLVFNVARRGYRAERVSPETHCSCPGGPAAPRAAATATAGV